MMSLSDFFMRPSGGSRSVVVEDSSKTPEGGVWFRTDTPPAPVSIDREISCPSAGTNVSAYREIGMSAFNVLCGQPAAT